MKMRPITGLEAFELAKGLQESCEPLKQLSDSQLRHLLSAVIHETTASVSGIEGRIEEAGVLPGDAVTIIMLWGAIAAIHGDLPGGDARRELFDAGKKVGLLIAQKYGEKIAGIISEKAGTH